MSAVQLFSGDQHRRTVFFPWYSVFRLLGAAVVFLFGQGSFNLHCGGPDWVCSSALSFAARHGVILPIAVGTRWLTVPVEKVGSDCVLSFLSPLLHILCYKVNLPIS
uniref:Uncharacterized protein n=1 Tax=Oryza nivara TaxID=4536 RepID=A0A0E0IJG6_ORYNI